MTDCC